MSENIDWSDRESILKVCETEGFLGLNFENLSEDLKKDRDFMLYLIREVYSELFIYADEELKRDREFVLAAVEEDGLLLKYVDEKFKKDPEVVCTAFKLNESRDIECGYRGDSVGDGCSVLKHADKDLLQDSWWLKKFVEIARSYENEEEKLACLMDFLNAGIFQDVVKKVGLSNEELEMIFNYRQETIDYGDDEIKKKKNEITALQRRNVLLNQIAKQDKILSEQEEKIEALNAELERLKSYKVGEK